MNRITGTYQTMKAIAELTPAPQSTEPESVEPSKSLETMKTQSEQDEFVDEFSESIDDFANSLSYELENEAYCKLPAYLKTHYQIEITERFIRTMIGGEEINLFAKAIRNTETLLVVGETVLRLDDRAKMGQLEKNVQVVVDQLHQPVFPLIVTHFANPVMLEQAREQGVLVVQSFEWN